MKSLILFLISSSVLLACNNKKTTATSTLPITIVKNTIDSNASILPVTDSFVKPTAKQLIVSGKSIGQISIDEKMEEVAKLLGIPDDGDAAMGKSLSIWYSKNSPNKYSTTIYSTSNFGDKDESKKVQNIRVTSPYFMTENYIKCGSALSYIQQKYPELQKPTSYYKETATQTIVHIFENMKDGIAFEINNANKCVGISVYKPGKRITQTYLPLFPDAKDF